MFDKIKKFVAEHPLETAIVVATTVTVAAVLFKNRTALKGGGFLELSGAAVNDLMDGKEVLVDALDDVYLLIKTVPKN